MGVCVQLPVTVAVQSGRISRPRRAAAPSCSSSRAAAPHLPAHHRPCAWRLAAAGRAAPPAPSPPRGSGRAADAAELDAELQRLCVELASAVTLPPEEEVVLLGLEPALATSPFQDPPSIDPATLPQPLVILRCKPEGDPAATTDTLFYLLGTAHVSAQSCADVARLIRAVRPQFVFLELCKERAAMLGPSVRVRQPTLGEAAALVRAGKATPFSILYSWLLAKVGKGMEVNPGEEFRVALQEAKACGARYVLGDRPVSVTMARMWAALSGWEKARLLGSLAWAGTGKVDSAELAAEVERLKQGDQLSQAVAEFAKDFPGVVGPLIHERDLFMVYVLRKLASYGDRVVAIVGAGHLKGIQEHWEDDISLEALMEVPRKK